MVEKQKHKVGGEVPDLLVPFTATDNEKLTTVGFIPASLVRQRGQIPGEVDYSVPSDLIQAARRGQYFLVYRTPKQLEVNRAFWASGHRGEKILQYIPDPSKDVETDIRGHRYLLESEGPSIEAASGDELHSIGKNGLLSSISDSVAALHTLSGSYLEDGENRTYNACAHYHLHTGNITLAGEGVALVDLKYVHPGQLDWSDPKRIVDYFDWDYRDLVKQTFPNLRTGEEVSKKEMGAALDSIVSKYPSSNDVKNDVSRRIRLRFSL